MTFPHVKQTKQDWPRMAERVYIRECVYMTELLDMAERLNSAESLDIACMPRQSVRLLVLNRRSSSPSLYG